jgi:rhomboid family GlyGly-CTERM serine protease
MWLADAGIASLELSRQSLSAGQVWTILTGPLLHVTFEHLLFDLLGLLIVGWIFEPMMRGGMAIIVLAINVAVAMAVFAIYPDVDSYRGLSSLDQGLLAAGAAALAWKRNWRAAAIIGIVLAAKWTFELLQGGPMMGFVSTDATRYGAPVPWTHAIGGLIGAASMLVWLGSADFRHRRRSDGVAGA